MDKSTESSVMYRTKAFALYSIVMAHSAYTSIDSTIVQKVLSRVSTIGVFLFLLISGYYYTKDGINQKYRLREFWRKKFVHLIIPWFVNASALYGLDVITHMGEVQFELSVYLNFIFGNGSLFYYMPILCFCYILCWNIAKSEKILWLCVILNIVSLALTAENVFPDVVNPYLNVFNWIGIFAIGILTRRYKILEYFLNLSKKRAMLIVIACVLIAIILTGIDTGYSYFTRFSFVIECLLSVCVLFAGNFCTKKIGRYLEYIGNITLPIYFWHMVILNFILDGEIARKSIMAAIVRPALTITLMSAAIYYMKIIAKKLHMNKIFGIVSGIRI